MGSSRWASWVSLPLPSSPQARRSLHHPRHWVACSSVREPRLRWETKSLLQARSRGLCASMGKQTLLQVRMGTVGSGGQERPFHDDALLLQVTGMALSWTSPLASMMALSLVSDTLPAPRSMGSLHQHPASRGQSKCQTPIQGATQSPGILPCAHSYPPPRWSPSFGQAGQCEHHNHASAFFMGPLGLGFQILASCGSSFFHSMSPQDWWWIY